MLRLPLRTMGEMVHDTVGASDGSAAQLRERIKELSCLYAMARVAQQSHGTLRATLEAVLTTVPQGWQWPEHLQAALEVDDEHVGAYVTSTRAMVALLVINGTVRGRLVVAYPDAIELPGLPIFLPEEGPLLEKLAMEVATIVERHEQRERQAMIDRHMLNTDRLTVLSELTAGIAHELNTPLGSVLGFAELLKREEDAPTRRADLQRIIDSALAGREIVKKLMYFSCEMPSQFHLLDLNEQVRQTLRLLQHRLDEGAIRTALDLGPDALVVRVDAVQFAQVVSNLVLNALGAMPQGGGLRISTERSGKHAIIHVQDDGTGILPENIPRIFQPFFTTKPAGEGTGLGLAVVHGIMKAHGGHITVSSEPGVGTLFTLSFPFPPTP
ncbi:MAG: sensor histidine kinase [Flavobacteriales bacterium]|nr:sensor histidine kinase [Flavobacteriales bacterium]MBL0037100.1 sensor histidine kinase [Flavobacteriales bacterium]